MKIIDYSGIILLAIAVAAIICLLAVALDRTLTVKYYKEKSDKINTNIKLALVTDLHGVRYGENQSELIGKIDEYKPDVVLMSGDIFDDETSFVFSKEFVSEISKKYRCFYAFGNHEFWSGKIKEIGEFVSSCGVTVLDGETAEININGNKIIIGGVNDLEYFGSSRYGHSTIAKEWTEQLENCKKALNENSYSVLLSHHPELVEAYEKSGFDLVVSGHAHGGQIRFPGIMNGLLAPNQGIFPKYAGGEYNLGKTKMIVSRGLCKNYLPRVFNPPELVIIEIEHK